MVNTTNYSLEKYETGDAANLLDQYNNSMDKLDAAIKTVSDKADLALNKNVLPEGLAAFVAALGINTETFTVTDLSKLKKTAEGYPIPPAK